MATKTPIAKIPAHGWLDWLAIFLATGFGSGYSPIAPGTAGTIVAVPIYLLLVYVWHIGLPIYIAIVIIIITVGSLVAQRAGRHFGLIDAGQIVIDEIAGFLVGMTAAPIGWPAILIGFILFRAFDILKPWPANYFDNKVANGFGVVMDDVAAGGYVLIIIQALKYFHIL